MRIPPERIQLCSPGVDTDLFKPAPAVDKLEYGKLRMTFVGNDFERKGRTVCSSS